MVKTKGRTILRQKKFNEESKALESRIPKSNEGIFREIIRKLINSK